MGFRYSRYIAHVVKHPWMIDVEKFYVLRELMRERLSGTRLSDEDIAARLATEPPAHVTPAKPTLAYMNNGVVAFDDDDYDGNAKDPVTLVASAGNSKRGGTIAVVPIHGTIAYRADTFEASSGGTSTEMIGRWLARMVADDSVKGILLDFNTPGGSVEGTPELATQIAKATAVKPVWAHVNAMAASAGYYLASQADEIICTPSGCVGSIGVFMLLIDESQALANEGIKINAISAGDFKLEGAPWEPLSPDAKAFLQAQVDAAYRDFLSAVAKGRGVSVADVKKHYGQGRVFDAAEAKDRGMIDRVATLEDTLARMVGISGRPVGRRAAATLKPESYMGDPAGQEDADPLPVVAVEAPVVASPAPTAVEDDDADMVAEHENIMVAMGRR